MLKPATTHLNISHSPMVSLKAPSRRPTLFQLVFHSIGPPNRVHTSDALVSSLGVTFDPRISLSNHSSNLSRSCFPHTFLNV